MSKTQNTIEEMFGSCDVKQQINDYCLLFLAYMHEAAFYFDRISTLIKTEQEREMAELCERAAKLPEAHQGDFWQDCYPCHWEYIFEEQLKNSFYISLFSILENYLECIRKATYSDKIKNIKKGGQFERYQKHFSQCASNTAKLNWNRIHQLWKIRCVLTHNQGYIEKESNLKYLQNFAKTTKGVKIENSYVHIDMSFCQNTLETLREFGRELAQILESHFAKEST